MQPQYLQRLEKLGKNYAVILENYMPDYHGHIIDNNKIIEDYLNQGLIIVEYEYSEILKCITKIRIYDGVKYCNSCDASTSTLLNKFLPKKYGMIKNPFRSGNNWSKLANLDKLGELRCEECIKIVKLEIDTYESGVENREYNLMMDDYVTWTFNHKHYPDVESFINDVIYYERNGSIKSNCKSAAKR